MSSPSRGAMCASEFCYRTALDTQRARGMPGTGRTHGPPATKTQAAVTTGSAEASGIPRAMVLTAASRSPRCAGLFGHRVRQRAYPRCAGHQRRDARTTRLDRAHQRRSSARMNHAATSIRPPHPASTSVTTAKRPSCETGRGHTTMISDKEKEKYSFGSGLKWGCA